MIFVSRNWLFLRSAPVNSGPILFPSPNSMWHVPHVFLNSSWPREVARRQPHGNDDAMDAGQFVSRRFLPTLPQCFSTSALSPLSLCKAIIRK